MHTSDRSLMKRKRARRKGRMHSCTSKQKENVFFFFFFHRLHIFLALNEGIICHKAGKEENALRTKSNILPHLSAFLVLENDRISTDDRCSPIFLFLVFYHCFVTLTHSRLGDAGNQVELRGN